MNAYDAVGRNPAIAYAAYLKIQIELTDYLFDGVPGNRVLSSAGLPLNEWSDYHLPFPGAVDRWRRCPVLDLKQ